MHAILHFFAKITKYDSAELAYFVTSIPIL